MIATQGQGDLAALKTGLASCADYTAFVGSAKKFATLSTKLLAADIDAGWIGAVHAPAGLNSGAVNPAEITLSLLAELTQVKRDILARAARNG